MTLKALLISRMETDLVVVKELYCMLFINNARKQGRDLLFRAVGSKERCFQRTLFLTVGC